MSQLDPQLNAVSADQLYYDIVVSNFKSTTTKPPVFYFNESRTLPFVRNPEEYYLSILRFTMETGSLPVFIPSIEPNQADRDLTIYSFTLEFSDPTLPGTTFTSGRKTQRGCYIRWCYFRRFSRFSSKTCSSCSWIANW